MSYESMFGLQGFAIDPEKRAIAGELQERFSSINEASVIADLVLNATDQAKQEEVWGVLQDALNECSVLDENETGYQARKLSILKEHCRGLRQSWG